MIVVVNLNTGGVTEYGLAWTDLAVQSGVVYGLSAAGIEALDEDGDTPGDWVLETGEMALAPGVSASLRELYLSVTADGPLLLTATGDQDGGERAVAYNVPALTGTKARDWPVRLAHGVFANAWRVRLRSAQAPCVMDLSGLRIILDKTRKRRR